MKNPKIKIEPSISDQIFECFGILGLIFLISLPIYFYSELPDTIPTHFNGSGVADDFSRKSTLWILTIIGISSYVGLFILNKFPHIFNYIVEINLKNAEIQYRIATKMIRFLNVLVTWLFVYITYSIIQVGLGNQSGLNSSYVFVFIGLMTILIAYFLIQSSKNK